MKRGIKIATWALVAAVVLSACSYRSVFPLTYRYRLTVTVATPAGERVGSSVIEVSTTEGIGIPGPEAGGVRKTIDGEAVAVDLPNGRTLFALLAVANGREGSGGYAHALLPPPKPEEANAALQRAERLRNAIGVAKLSPVPITPGQGANFPMLIMFEDIRKSASIIRLDPNNIAATLGSGYALKSVTVEITTDKVTRGIVSRLSWLDSPIGRMVSGYARYPDFPEKELTRRAFILTDQ